MFNLYKKQPALKTYQHQNLTIDLPAHWQFEKEADGQQAFYDPKSQSTLRIHIIKAISPLENAEETLKSLTNNHSYSETQKGYLLTNPTYTNKIDSNQNITLITWRLINNSGAEKIIAILSYTVLSAEKNDTKEKETINLIANSLQTAELA